jgi:hypothetical protein
MKPEQASSVTCFPENEMMVMMVIMMMNLRITYRIRIFHCHVLFCKQKFVVCPQEPLLKLGVLWVRKGRGTLF